jgi:hypothetical protein
MCFYLCLAGLLRYSLQKLVPAWCPDFDADVRCVTISRTDLADIRIGPVGAPGIRVDSLRVTYSFTGLLKRQISSIAVGGLRIRVEEQDGRLVIPGLNLEQRPPAGKKARKPKGAFVRSCAVRDAVLSIATGGFRGQVPFDVYLNDLSAARGLALGAIAVKGTPSASLRPLNNSHGGRILFKDGGLATRDRWLLSLDPDGPGKLEEQTFSVDIEGSCSADGKWDLRVVTEPCQGGLPLPENGGRLSWRAETGWVSGQGSGPNGAMEFLLELADITVDGQDTQVALPRVKLTGKGLRRKSHKPVFKATLKLADARLETSALRADKIDADLPLHWPWDGDDQAAQGGPRGRLTVGSMRSGQSKLGSCRYALAQHKLGYVFSGRHLGIAEGPAPLVNGRLGIDLQPLRLSLAYALLESNLVVRTDNLLPDLKARLTGTVSLTGRAGIEGGRIDSRLLAVVSNATFEIEEKNAIVEGIDLRLQLTDLQQVQSPPNQSLTFVRAALGKLETGEGRVAFRIESPTAVFLERCNFNWCGGRVGTHAVRFESGKDDLDLTLQCDRIELTEALSQVKVLDSTGEGRVSGQVPLSRRKGDFSVTNGFLFSTPGSRGTMRVRDSDGYLGIAGGGLAHEPLQLEISREALRDYTYDWARLTMNSSGHDLIVQLKMDGRPNRKLPFDYDSKTGLVKSSETDATFRGIRFDMNFKLPVNRLLRIGKKMNSLLNPR